MNFFFQMRDLNWFTCGHRISQLGHRAGCKSILRAIGLDSFFLGGGESLEFAHKVQARTWASWQRKQRLVYSAMKKVSFNGQLEKEEIFSFILTFNKWQQDFLPSGWQTVKDYNVQYWQACEETECLTLHWCGCHWHTGRSVLWPDEWHESPVRVPVELSRSASHSGPY